MLKRRLPSRMKGPGRVDRRNTVCREEGKQRAEKAASRSEEGKSERECFSECRPPQPEVFLSLPSAIHSLLPFTVLAVRC